MFFYMQGWAKVSLALWVWETQSLFLYYYLLIIVFFSTQTTLNLLLPHPVYLWVVHDITMVKVLEKRLLGQKISSFYILIDLAKRFVLLNYFVDKDLY